MTKLVDVTIDTALLAQPEIQQEDWRNIFDEFVHFFDDCIKSDWVNIHVNDNATDLILNDQRILSHDDEDVLFQLLEYGWFDEKLSLTITETIKNRIMPTEIQPQNDDLKKNQIDTLAKISLLQKSSIKKPLGGYFFVPYKPVASPISFSTTIIHYSTSDTSLQFPNEPVQLQNVKIRVCNNLQSIADDLDCDKLHDETDGDEIKAILSLFGFQNSIVPSPKLKDFTDIRNAKDSFFKHLNGDQLADKVEPYWGSGAKFLREFTESARKSYAHEIYTDRLPQLKVAINTYIPGTEKWITDVHKSLSRLYNRLNASSVPKIFRNLAVLFKENNLDAQAIITLRVTIEAAIAIKYANATYICNYEWWDGKGKYKKKSGKGSFKLAVKAAIAIDPTFDSKPLEQLMFKLRGGVAHGDGSHGADNVVIWNEGLKAVDHFLRLI